MKTPITYYGGKQTLLKDILPLIPEHRVYTETFCGGAAVLFGKERAEVEVINDINMHITNFYWVAKVYYPDLKQEIERLFIAGTYMNMQGISLNFTSFSLRYRGLGLFGYLAT